MSDDCGRSGEGEYERHGVIHVPAVDAEPEDFDDVQRLEHDPHDVHRDRLPRLPGGLCDVRRNRDRKLESAEDHQDQEEREADAFDAGQVASHHWDHESRATEDLDDEEEVGARELRA